MNNSFSISKLHQVIQDQNSIYIIEHKTRMNQICKELKHYYCEDIYCADNECECCITNIHCYYSECRSIVLKKEAIIGTLFSNYYCCNYCQWNDEYECRKSYRQSLRNKMV